jgi:hypothetical protein
MIKRVATERVNSLLFSVEVYDILTRFRGFSCVVPPRQNENALISV